MKKSFSPKMEIQGFIISAMICDVIKQNEFVLANTDFKIHPNN